MRTPSRCAICGRAQAVETTPAEFQTLVRTVPSALDQDGYLRMACDGCHGGETRAEFQRKLAAEFWATDRARAGSEYELVRAKGAGK